MASPEARALLVEQGARIANAVLKRYEATREWADAVRSLTDSEHADELRSLSSEEQEACWIESCQQAGISVKHPALSIYRHEFQSRGIEERIEFGRENATWN